MEAVRLGNELTPMEQENLPPVHKLDAEKVELVEQRNNRRFKMKMPTFRRRAAKETVNEEAEDEEEEEVVEAETEEMPKKRVSHRVVSLTKHQS